MISQWVRKDLQGFEPYSAPMKPYRHKLDANESPYRLPERVRDAMIHWLENSENLNIYPDTDNTELRNALGIYWNVLPEKVTCGVGSDQLIDYITKVFLEPGDCIVTPTPTFSMYAQSALLNKGRVVELPMNDCYETDAEQILSAVRRENGRILFLCTPNNPTGRVWDREQVLAILEAVDCPVVVDEAYEDFADSDSSYNTLIPVVDRYRNLIVLRTFSKAFGLAGARIGYAIACEEMIQSINIAKAPYNLPTFSQVIGVEALREHEVYQKRIAVLRNQRRIVMDALSHFPWLKTFPSEANFIFMVSEKAVAGVLEENGIMVRRFAGEDGKEKIRLSIGTEEENRDVIRVLEEIG